LYTNLAWISTGRWREMASRGKYQLQSILQSGLFCRCEGKWVEVPFIQTFFALQGKH
jgi:hypothetical protein